MIRVDVGIFAYNEEKSIPFLLEDLSLQSILSSENFDVQIFILANGCNDQTVAVCNQQLDTKYPLLAAVTNVFDMEQGGKSRTWEAFTHTISRPDATTIVYMDADIRLKDTSTLEQLVYAQSSSPLLKVVCSRPIKDIANTTEKLTPIEKLILSAGGTSDDWKKSVCGQLYAVDAETTKAIHMPIGLPVEDGFIRAMILTNLLTKNEDTSIIDGFDDISHEYESIRTISELLSHQVRIVIGSSINFAIFNFLDRHGGSLESNANHLKESSKDEQWLHTIVKSSYPTLPYGYIPFHFATKRILAVIHSKPSLKKLFIGIAGFFFDGLVWFIASYKMLKGKGVGYW